MQHAEVLDAVRRLIRHSFAELGAPADAEVSETILIRHEHYCGRRFRTDTLQAIWFIEEDEIKVYAPGGEVLRVTSAREALQHTPLREYAVLERRAA